MNIDHTTTTPPSNPIGKWAIRLGAAGLFGGVLVCMSKGGGVACASGMALPAGLFAAAIGAIVGVVVKVVKQ